MTAMTARERALFIFAAIASVAVHCVIIYNAIGLSLGYSGERLFTADTADENLIAVDIQRDPKDLFMEDKSLAEVLNPDSPAPGAAAERVRDVAEELIEGVEPSTLATSLPEPAGPPSGFAAAAEPDISPEAPSVEPAAPGGPTNLDTTRQLLALAQPAVEPPAFVAADDEAVTLPGEAPPSFGEGFDPGDLDAAIGSGAGLGRGNGAGVAADDGAIGTGRGSGAPAAPRAARAPVAKAAPLPGLPAEAIPTPLPVEEKPAIHLDQDFNYRLIAYTEPPPKRGLFGGDPQEPQQGYMEVRIEPQRSLRRLKPLKKDIVWAIDTSSSVTGKWMEPVKRGVGMALETLNEGDRFNIVLFKDQVTVLSPEGMVDATPENLAAARAFLTQAEASGFTDVNAALGKLLVREVPPDRVYQIILISDGVPTRGAIDPRSIINLITRENDLTATIYCVGIGDRINRELLQYVAYRNKGFVAYPENAWKASESIAELAGRLRYPIVKDATFTAVGIDDRSVYPRIPRDIYQNEPVSLFGRFGPDADKLSMRITGVNDAELLDLTFTLEFRSAERGDEQVMQNWAFWRLHHLYSEVIREGETPQLQKQIADLKKRYKIKTSY